MAIPYANTTVVISRVEEGEDDDGYDPNPPRPNEIARGVRAVVSMPSASATLVGGDRIVYNATLTCDVTDLQANDTIEDVSTGLTWRCLTVVFQGGLGIDHMVANLRLVSGAAS